MSQVTQRSPWPTRVVVLVLVAVFVAFMFWFLPEARKSAWRMQRANCMRQIGIGLLNYESCYRCLPDPVYMDDQGQPLSSWRFRLAGFIESIMRDWDFTARWDAPGNQWLTGSFHYCYCLPSSHSGEQVQTNVVLITGPETAFDGHREYSLHELDADQILAIEVLESGIPWAAPGDISIEDVSPSILQGLDGDGVHVLFADAEVGFIPVDTPFEDLKKFFTVEGAKENDREEVFGTGVIVGRP